MNLRTSLILILFVVVVLAGLFLWNQSRNVVLEGGPTSPVLVDIITPTNGSSIIQGSTLSILAKAWSPNPITALQLWEDGQMISAENVEGGDDAVNYSWDLNPTEIGVHTYFVRATDSEGEAGQSPTLILNVSAAGFQQILAADGNTLGGISSQTGFSVDEIAALNPGLDPSRPLGDGQTVILPPHDDGGSLGQGLADDPGVPDLVIHWKFKPTSGVDNSYCYQSVGGENWHRVPDLPFSFLPGDEWIQTPFFEPTMDQLNLLLECWGWQGDTLVYLGEGETSLNFQQVPSEVIIVGEGFQANGLPEMKPLSSHGTAEEGVIPPPFALREAESVNECASHYGGNFWANQICDELMNISPKQYYVFVWEWTPGFCWGPCPWGDSIDGYAIYEVDPSLQSGNVIKLIPNGNQKVTAVILPWGGKCYAVRAYIEATEGKVLSDAALYCGMPPEPQKLVLTPQEWLSTEGDLYVIGCGTYGVLSYFLPTDKQLYAGSGFVNRPFECIKEFDATAAVKFNLGILEQDPGMVIQRATLLVSQIDIAYDVGSDVAVGFTPDLCVTRVGKSSTAWTNLSSSHFVEHNNILSQGHIPPTGGGFSWLPEGGLGKDVTSTVLQWIDDPASNNGFVLSTSKADLFNRYILEPNWDAGGCFSLFEVELEILYFTPN